MVTIIVEIQVKKEYLSEYLGVARLLTEKFSVLPGCYKYDFYQDKKDSCKFRLIEEWAGLSSLDSHHDKLISLLGLPKPGEVLPERLVRMYDKAEPSFYSLVE